jgi:hypothetical protein
MHGGNFGFKTKYSEKSAEVIQFPLTFLSSGKADLKSNFDRAALVFGSATILIGTLGLLGWISWLRVFLGIRWDYISIAPITAAAFVIFGVILILLARKHYYGRRKVFVSTIMFPYSRKTWSI